MFPYQPIDKPIPAPGPDAGRLCFSFDAKWQPILFGLLQTLLAEQTWSTNRSLAINEAENLIYDFMLATACSLPSSGGIEVDDCMGCCIRWSDTGVLQVFSCGEWQDVPGIAGKSLANGSQPAQGQPQPDPGGCENWIGKVLFFGRWLMPVPVSSGDQITVSNAFGASTDYLIDFPAWRCGDGTIFEAGGCINGTATFNGGDPDPSIHHGNLIGFDGTNYYDFGEAANSQVVTATILPGISNVNFVFMLNSAGPAGAGDNSFDVRLCKGAAVPLSITYNLGLGTGPSAAVVGSVIDIAAVFYAPSGDYVVYPVFSQPVKIQVVQAPGYTEDPAFNATFWTWTPHGGSLQSCNRLQPCDGSDPRVFDQTIRIDDYQLISDTAMTAQLKILAIG
jgi:hypothetical protein